ELRTPLARILGEVELLQRRERSAEERAGAHDAIARSAEQMLRILDVLMAAARAEAAPAGAGRSRLGQALADATAGAERALARRLARAAGGDVRAEPRGGAGATFVVDLPA